MKQFLIALFVLIPTLAFGQATDDDLVGLGLDSALAEALTSGLSSDAALALTGATGATITATTGNASLLSTAGDVIITGSGDDVLVTAADDVVIQGGGSGDIVTIAGGGTAVDVTVADNMVTLASGTELTLGGDIISTTTNIGAGIASGANTACDTTCAVADGACVFGWDTSGTQADIVACDGATADECLCLAAS